MPRRAFVLVVLCSLAWGAESTLPPEAIVEHYCAAIRGQDRKTQGASMEIAIAASLPKLEKRGTMTALRKVSALGRITYEKLRFDGDTTIKKQVITRYLTAEAAAQDDKERAALAVTPDNYKFKFKGEKLLDGRDTYEFEVSPKHKRQGVFRGELWIDAATYLRVREAGYLVKSPSFLLKKVAFVRTYEIRDGISVPRQEQTMVDTRMGVGRAEMTIDYSNFEIDSASGAADIQ